MFIGTLRESDVYGSPTFLLSQNDKPKEDLTIGRSIYVQVTMLKVKFEMKKRQETCIPLISFHRFSIGITFGFWNGRDAVWNTNKQPQCYFHLA